MSYPLTCYAGYPMPIRTGKFEIVGFSATANDATADSQVALLDDPGVNPDLLNGRILSTLPVTQKGIIINIPGLANIDSYLAYDFGEPVKVRNGLSIYTENIKAGTFCVYVR